MNSYRRNAVVTLIASLIVASQAPGQFMNERTVIVDPKATAPADRQTIQEAIDAILIQGLDPQQPWTVFIHAGVYAENIVLNEHAENINLVGIDRDAVIIKPGSGDGITITSGTEASRNNAIRNLTIDTRSFTGGHGILIQQGQGGQVPKNINIEGVTIRTDGLDKHGIEGSAAEDARIFDCDIDAGDAMGIHVGSRFQILSSSVQNDSTRENIGAIHITGGKTQITVENSFIRGNRSGIYTIGPQTSSNVEIGSSTILAAKRAVFLWQPGQRWVFRNCGIRSENVDRDGNPIEVPENENLVHGVNFHFNDPGGEVIFLSCRIEGIGRTVPEGQGVSPGTVTGIRNDSFENCRFIECDVTASAFIADEATKVFGIDSPSARLIAEGGSVRSGQFDPIDGSPYDRAINIFDLHDLTPGDLEIFVSGTTFTKWHGPIGAAGTPGTVTQTTTKVSPASDTAVHDPIPLTQSEQEIETDITDPDVNRVLSITRSHTDIVGDVYLIGTNRGDEPIVEKISFEQPAPELTLAGQRPFKTVTKIIVPGYSGSGENREISVGTTDVIGLYYPIADEEDVLQFARKANGAGSYTIESFQTGAVDVIFSTFNIQSVVADDSFEWRIQTGQ